MLQSFRSGDSLEWIRNQELGKEVYPLLTKEPLRLRAQPSARELRKAHVVVLVRLYPGPLRKRRRAEDLENLHQLPPGGISEEKELAS